MTKDNNEHMNEILSKLDGSILDSQTVNTIFCQVLAILKYEPDDIDMAKAYSKAKHCIEKKCMTEEQKEYLNLGKILGVLNAYFNIKHEEKDSSMSEKYF